MSIEVSTIGRLRVAVETGASAFGVDQSGTPSNFIDIPVVENSIQSTRAQEKLNPLTLQNYLDDYSKSVLGPKSTTLNFSSILAGTGTPLLGNTAVSTAANNALYRMLETIMGYATVPGVSGAVTQVQAASTTTTINVTATHGANFTPGSVIGCLINGRMEVREILSRSGDAIGVKVAFSAVPATSSQVYYGITFCLTADPANSLQFIHNGAESADHYMYGGLQGGFDLDVSTGQLPKINYKLAGAIWSQISSSLAVGSISNFSPAATMDSEFIVGTVGSTTRNVVHCSAETWSPNIKYTMVKSPSGVNTILRARRARDRVISAKFTQYRDSSMFDFEAAEAAKTSLALFKQLGSTPGSTVFLSAPTVQVISHSRTDADGLAATEISVEGRNDEALQPASSLGQWYRQSALKISII